MTSTYPAASVAMAPVETRSPSMSWGAVVAGAVAAAALTFVLMLLGSGLGLTIVSPWASESTSLATFAVSTAIWLVLVQWLSSGMGGYLAGRLRARRDGDSHDETFFRDSAHGLVTWALATLLIVMLIGGAMSGILGTGMRAASNVASGAAMGASAGAANASTARAANPASYFVDLLFREGTAAQANPAADTDGGAAAQASRILAEGALSGAVTADDKAYLSQLVASRTGLSPADATARVDSVLARVNDARMKAQETAETARKAGATFALLGTLSLVLGGFIACVAAVIGGRQRDEDGHVPQRVKR